MDTSILISELNDFVFCPKSIYWHHLYGRYNTSMYHETYQKRGAIHHEAIDQGEYSSAQYFLQGKEVSSQKYGLIGKIDIYDTRDGTLIERKYKISTVYQGYLWQIYAQALCLIEMGYDVSPIALHSLSDNKRYYYEVPSGEELERFEKMLEEFHAFRMGQHDGFEPNPLKCAKCIYRHLCDSCPNSVLDTE